MHLPYRYREICIFDFKELYHYRWQIEEAYKLLKARVEVEHFSGETALAVKQDFLAKVFLMTLCAVYAHPIEERVIAEYKADNTRKHAQQINRTHALRATKEILIAVMLKNQFQKARKSFDELVYLTREIIRPDRKVERGKTKKKLFSKNYKPL